MAVNEEVDISAITDLSRLYKLYVQCNEILTSSQRQVEIQTSNLQLIRNRLQQLETVDKTRTEQNASPPLDPPAESAGNAGNSNDNAEGLAEPVS